MPPRPTPVASPRAALLAAMLGGMLGAVARWQLQERTPTSEFGWTVLAINVGGSALMGVLMAWVASGTAPALARPFLGVGVLGGFTTFSAYAVDVVTHVDAGHPVRALCYLVATVVAAVLAVVVGSLVGERWWPRDQDSRRFGASERRFDASERRFGRRG
ncbi:fluoride efflux transporter FluC [Nocardioides sp. Bht2]|uniref:fluoride efflux transporter FluC n=1 Tax=Nocardioides sp. Bht2 TaxID=3392297 RepID=UPI0039B478CD